MRRFRGRRRRWKTRGLGETGLSLTSLMDILTCLLFFVLKSFVAGGETTVPPPGLDLPASTADKAMVTSLVIAIDQDEILIGSEHVATLKEAAESKGMLIEPLAARLQAVREQMDEIASQQAAGQRRPRIVTIQGDEDIEFAVLQKVMYTVNQGGFDDIALAVLKKA